MVNFRQNPNVADESIIENSELLELLNYKLNALETRTEYYQYNEVDKLEYAELEISELEKQIVELESKL